ncbi:hypothetical protein LDENG_00067540 [Lucifuga dentata]|nr:hypothetical protein LDENG_00067540 [Lucifuga dentata]
MAQAYYATTARTREESPPHSPEQHAVNAQCHYQGSGVVYLDSWSSGSSRDGSLPQADPATWVKKDPNDETESTSPDPNEDVSSSLTEEPQNFNFTGAESTNSSATPLVSSSPPKKQSATAANNPKGKVRTAFSEGQMNALVQRFSVQRYLTPAEMKNLAEVTGLTYKQVKTWFQNRRMKLRRHQKDTSWVSERYINKGNPMSGSIFTNYPPHIQTYQGEAHNQLKEQYNQQMMDVTAYKKTAPQNLAFYLASAGSAGYPSWSSTSAQSAAPSRPQTASWSMPPPLSHYEYNPNAYGSVSEGNNTGHEGSFETKDGEPIHGRNPLIMHNNSH